MSTIIDSNKIDVISYKDNELILVIVDHLDWSNEHEHLIILQDKINAYLGFVENKEYVDTYPNRVFDGYTIEIHFYMACRKMVCTF